MININVMNLYLYIIIILLFFFYNGHNNKIIIYDFVQIIPKHQH